MTRTLPRRDGARPLRPLLIAPLAALLLAALTALTACSGVISSPSSKRSAPSTSASSSSGGDISTDDGDSSISPARVTIASVGVDSPLMQLGLNSDSTVEVPPADKGMTAGWYAGSAVPGQPGPSVIIGHNDTRYGRAVFHDLRTVKPGADVAIRLSDGRTVHYTVTSLQRVSKSAFPTEQVYGPASGHVLRLITCDGVLDANGHPVDNLIVYGVQR
ncbi:sortase [Streptomyces sp. RB6PN25]|uniref:Sortase n=1 Tax=Streptomyces humicola TaxID=2953240 RepID=A0ABT1Q251_9ACTN|nr:class F sortase [Streptomyces humicola]MCQ4082835.1 sortase [Streptomyces humicola]